MDSKSWKYRIYEVTSTRKNPGVSGSIFFQPPKEKSLTHPQKISTTPVSGWLSIASLQSLVQTHVRDETPKACQRVLTIPTMTRNLFRAFFIIKKTKWYKRDPWGMDD